MITQDTLCTVCSSKDIQTITDFGNQPPANRFIAKNNLEKPEDLYPLSLGFCTKCQTVQLTKRMPMNAIRPRFSWMLYNEPELHLDDVAECISKLPGIDVHSTVLGLTYKDQSTLDRLEKLGLCKGECLTKENFDIFQSPSLKSTHPKVNLLIARHVVEHTDDVSRLVKELKTLILPNGYLIVELPDSEKILKAGNHPFIWEEHISYFIESSLETIAKEIGAKIVWAKKYPYNFEDSLLAAFQFEAIEQKEPKIASNPSTILQQFNQTFLAAKNEWRKLLESYTKQGEKIAVFGAGHLAVKWVNFMNLSDLVECIIDDNANKAGMYMPGSKLPILPSTTLFEKNIKICISTLSPESEQKVKQKFTKYFEMGGKFIPAFKTLEAKS